MDWQANELKAFEWFKEKFDDNAVLAGGSNSTVSDIFSPRLQGFVEIKTLNPSAFGGQFTISTAEFDVCKRVIDGELTSETAISFAQQHYRQRMVKGFVVISDSIEFYSWADFFRTFNFAWQKRGKKSGTSSAPRKYWQALNEIIPGGTFASHGKLYVTDEANIGNYYWIDNNEFFISQLSAGEVRKCSHTQNETWLVTITK